MDGLVEFDYFFWKAGDPNTVICGSFDNLVDLNESGMFSVKCGGVDPDGPGKASPLKANKIKVEIDTNGCD